MTGPDILDAAIGSVITLAVGGTGYAVSRWIKRRVKVDGPLAEVQAEVASLMRIVRCLFKIQAPQLIAQTAILEAIQGDVNGNVTAALKGIRKASKDFDEFRDETVVGECKE